MALVGALMPAAAVLHAGGLSTQLGEVVIENLQVGQTYVLSKFANLKMIVTNTSDFPVNLRMEVLKPDSSELRLGALMIPKASWVRLSQDHFKIAPNEQAQSEITISIPDNNDFRGKRFQVIIWSHTLPDEGSGMFLAYGLKSRLIFTIDSVRTPQIGVVDSVDAPGDFVLKPGMIQLDTVPLGILYDVEKREGQVLEITNSCDHEQAFRLQSLPVSKTLTTLEEGFEDTPDASFLKFSEDRFVLQPGQKKTIKVYLNIPVEHNYRGKHYMFIVRAIAENEHIVASVYSRLLASIPKE